MAILMEHSSEICERNGLPKLQNYCSTPITLIDLRALHPLILAAGRKAQGNCRSVLSHRPQVWPHASRRKHGLLGATLKAEKTAKESSRVFQEICPRICWLAKWVYYLDDLGKALEHQGFQDRSPSSWDLPFAFAGTSSYFAIKSSFANWTRRMTISVGCLRWRIILYPLQVTKNIKEYQRIKHRIDNHSRAMSPDVW